MHGRILIPLNDCLHLALSTAIELILPVLGSREQLVPLVGIPGEMANDREILREIWEGKIPVHFQLSSDETDVEPEEFFLLIPRLSYFPLVTDKVRLFRPQDSPGNSFVI